MSISFGGSLELVLLFVFSCDVTERQTKFFPKGSVVTEEASVLLGQDGMAHFKRLVVCVESGVFRR